MRLAVAITVETLCLLLCGLLAGALLGIWLIFDPSGLDAAAYILQQQHGVRALNIPMPALGVSSLLMTAICAALAVRDRVRFIPLLVASLLLLAAGVVTRFFNQPINAVMMTWLATMPPPEWMDLRDEWWFWHQARFILSLVAFCLIVGQSVTKAFRGG